MQVLFTGSATALITPFSNGAPDLKALSRLVDFQIERGTSALVVLGTTGEPSTMTAEEKKDVLQTVIRQANGRVPVVAGAGSNNTAEAVEAAQLAHTLGANGLLVVTPYYNKCSPAGLFRHFEQIAAATPLPIIAYNVPGRTGLNLTPAVARKLAELPTMAGIKEASGNMDQITELAATCPLPLYSGDDAIILPVLAVGGKGVISVLGNIMPAQVQALCSSFFSGDVPAARKWQLSLYPLIKALFSEVNPMPVKAAAALLGLCGPEVRLPLCELEQKNQQWLQNELRAQGLLL